MKNWDQSWILEPVVCGKNTERAKIDRTVLEVEPSRLVPNSYLRLFTRSWRMSVPVSRLMARGCCELAGISFPEPPLFALKAPLHCGQGSAQWSRSAFLLWNLISLQSDDYWRWSYDSTQDLWDFRSVGHEGSRSTWLWSWKNRSVDFILPPKAVWD